MEPTSRGNAMTEIAHPCQVTILIAEDDDGHAALIQDLLKESGVRNPIRRFRDGQDVLDFLKNPPSDRQSDPNEGFLLLLDIRMPRISGTQVLTHIKNDPALRTIPVIMLTTTDDPEEIQKCYELGCNCYITKPVVFDHFATALRQLGFFLMIMQVPKRSTP
jgi:CheY-like chemotaxis protein